jgi:hypothetical protein
MAFAPSASAAEGWYCVGTQDLGFVCVDPTGRTLVDDCVYVVIPPCIPVVVPGPTFGCGGPLHCDL